MTEERVGKLTVNLLGNIARALTSLRGIDVMAYELIQNAEDSHATQMVINIDDDGIRILTDSVFRNCSDREKDNCLGLNGNKLHKCDWHNIREIAGGEKGLNETQSIGRFGIGFMSVYQVTDTPEISSDNLRMVFDPSSQSRSVVFSDIDFAKGTSLFLPWALNRESDARRRFTSAPVIKMANYNQIASEFGLAAMNSLLFLSSLKQVEVFRNGNKLHTIAVNDINQNVREIVLGPRTLRIKWFLLRNPDCPSLKEIEIKDPIIANQRRRRSLDIAIPISGLGETEGRLYAFLPTQEKFELPIHVNGDFFPDESRKRIIFNAVAENDSTAQWNQAIVASAAHLFAESLEIISSELSNVAFWKLIKGAFLMQKTVTRLGSNYPKSYGLFWECIKEDMPKYSLVLCEDGIKRKIQNVVIANGERLPEKRKTISNFGLFPVSSELKQFEDLLRELGAADLSLEHIIESHNDCSWLVAARRTRFVSVTTLNEKFEPLWELLDEILSDYDYSHDEELLSNFAAIDFFLTENLHLTTLKESVMTNKYINIENASLIFPDVTFLHKNLGAHKYIKLNSQEFDLYYLIPALHEKISQNILTSGDLDLIYGAISEVIHGLHLDNSDVDLISSLEIWPNINGQLISGKNAKVPGDFSDPLGIAGLIDLSRISKSGLGILETRLRIDRLTIDNYVCEVLPAYFNSPGITIDASAFGILLQELADHPRILDSEKTLLALKRLPFIPRLDGELVAPASVTLISEDGMKIFSSGYNFWIDSRFHPTNQKIVEFLLAIGVKKVPSFSIILQHWEKISREQIPKEAKLEISMLVNYMISNRNNWQDSEVRDAIEISDFNNQRRFPVFGDPDLWHIPVEIYSPEWMDTFYTCNEALVLDIAEIDKSTYGYFESYFGIRSEPDISLVLRHIKNLIAKEVGPSKRVYVLLDRLIRADSSGVVSIRINEMRDDPLIYLEGQFYRPSRLFLNSVQLGKRFSQLDSSFVARHQNLVNALEIHSDPNAEDLISVMRELSVSERDISTEEFSEIEGIYQQSLRYLDGLMKQERIDPESLRILQTEQLFLTRSNQWTDIKNAVIPDSEWFDSKLQSHFNEFMFTKCDFATDLLQHFGANHLSSSVKSRILSSIGEKTINHYVEESINSRRELIDVVFTKIIDNTELANRWPQVKVLDVQRIKTIWSIKTDYIESQEIEIESSIHFDTENATLYLERNEHFAEDDAFWLDVFIELLSQLLPSVDDSIIKTNTLVLSSLMSLPYEKGRAKLEHMKYRFDVDSVASSEEFMTSSVVGNSADPDTFHEIDENENDHDYSQPQNEIIDSDVTDNSLYFGRGDEAEIQGIRQPQNERESKSPLTEESNLESVVRSATSKVQLPRENGIKEADVSEKLRIGSNTGDWKSGPKSWNRGQSPIGHDHESSSQSRSTRDHLRGKKETIRNAYIYVTGSDTEETAYRRAVGMENEILSRDFVMNYEKNQGRTPIEMSQTNPGYDIESRDPNGSKSKRFIEVKSISGEWGADGVDISPSQIMMAYEKGDEFWLYIIERVNSENRRMYLIQNPAKYTRAFKFNDAWKELALSLELEDLQIIDVSDPIGPEDIGCAIFHASFGECFLIDWIPRGVGAEVVLRFTEFDEDLRRPFNPRTMKKING